MLVSPATTGVTACAAASAAAATSASCATDALSISPAPAPWHTASDGETKGTSCTGEELDSTASSNSPAASSTTSSKSLSAKGFAGAGVCSCASSCAALSPVSPSSRAEAILSSPNPKICDFSSSTGVCRSSRLCSHSCTVEFSSKHGVADVYFCIVTWVLLACHQRGTARVLPHGYNTPLHIKTCREAVTGGTCCS